MNSEKEVCNIPFILKGGVSVDDRGCVRFVNDFDFVGVKRFYQVSNHEKGFIRAWHGHKHEGKYVYVAKGSALIGVVKMSERGLGTTNYEPKKFVLSDKNPSVLWIPPGYFNGAMTLEDDTQIMYFSTATIKESKDDDIRYDWKVWNIWEVERR